MLLVTSESHPRGQTNSHDPRLQGSIARRARRRKEIEISESQ